MTLDDKVVNITARNMKNNVIISGLVETGSQENCKELVTKFISDHYGIEPKEHDILVAHRLGKKLSINPGPMVINCLYHLREKLLSNSSCLKDVKNQLGDYYRVSRQLPEPLSTHFFEQRLTPMVFRFLAVLKPVAAAVTQQIMNKTHF